MKICIITTIFPPDIGGPATYSYEVSKRLSALGNEVHVVSYGNTPYENKDNIHIHRVNVVTKLKPINLFLKVKRARDEIVRIVRMYNIDIIYAQNPDLAGIPAYLASKKTGKPYYIKFIGDWAWETAYRKQLTNSSLDDFYNEDGSLIIKAMKNLQKKVLNKASLIITPNEYLKSILIKSGVKTRISVIENAVEELKIEKKPLPKLTIVMAGRLVAHKRFDKIIQIMPKLLKNVDAELLIIGDGPEMIKLKQLTNNLNLGEKVKFLGSMDYKLTMSYIASSNLFILPSLYEGMSHLLLEAMIYKTSILASAISGNLSILKDKENALLFNPENREETVEKILYMVKNKQQVKKLAQAAYKQVTSRNTWQNHLNLLVEQFSSIAQNKAFPNT